jgi:lipopolysaccharide export system permease protein
LEKANINAVRQAIKGAPYGASGMLPVPHLSTTILAGTPVRERAINAALGRARMIVGNCTNQAVLIDYNHRRIDEFLVEINKKYSIPAACFVFVLIGAPLGIIARRGTFGVAATFSLGFFILYWASLIGGEKLADRNLISPWLGMWGANIVLFIIGVYLTIRMGKETPAINWTALRKWIPKYFRSETDNS